MQDFRRLKVWAAGHTLTLDIYKVTQGFPKAEVYGLTSQLRRASVSVPTNIAEGSARLSDAGTRYFLEIALGSATEVEYLLLLAGDLGLITAATQSDFTERTEALRKMLNAFIRRLRTSTPKAVS
jgi:four helix bundle protein